MPAAAPQLAAQHVGQHPSSSSSTNSCCGLVASDMGQGLPLRPASLDGAISISALQWIINTAQQTPAPQQQQQQPGNTLWPAQLAAASSSSSSSSSSSCCRQVKLLAFFSSLAAVLVPWGAAVAQFYPRDPDEAQVGDERTLFCVTMVFAAYQEAGQLQRLLWQARRLWHSCTHRTPVALRWAACVVPHNWVVGYPAVAQFYPRDPDEAQVGDAIGDRLLMCVTMVSAAFQQAGQLQRLLERPIDCGTGP
jgi:hypothetical protein